MIVAYLWYYPDVWRDWWKPCFGGTCCLHLQGRKENQAWKKWQICGKWDDWVWIKSSKGNSDTSKYFIYMKIQYIIQKVCVWYNILTSSKLKSFVKNIFWCSIYLAFICLHCYYRNNACNFVGIPYYWIPLLCISLFIFLSKLNKYQRM